MNEIVTVPIIRSPLNSIHTEAGTRLEDFGGWQLPAAYKDVETEKARVLYAVGICDCSNTGKYL